MITGKIAEETGAMGWFSRLDEARFDQFVKF
jgi:hypothetical protein